MTSDDSRHEGAKFPVARYEFAQGEWASGESGALEKTLYGLTGTIYAIEVVVSTTTNNITFTVALVSENSAALYSKASIADDGSTWLDSESNKATQDADFNPIPVVGNVIATLTPSGDPGTSGATCDVLIYMR